MSIWYSISAQFTLHPNVNWYELTVALADYNEDTVPAARVEGNTVYVEVEGDMSRSTADALYTGLVQLIRHFGNGETVCIFTRSSDEDDTLCCHYIGRKAAVLTALTQGLMRRLEALRASLADKADDVFVEVETEGW